MQGIWEHGILIGPFKARETGTARPRHAAFLVIMPRQAQAAKLVVALRCRSCRSPAALEHTVM